MKKKAAIGLLLPIILLAGCSESNWPTQDDIEQIEQGLNASLSEVDSKCDFVLFVKPDGPEEPPQFTISLRFDGGTDFGKKCEIVSDFIKEFSNEQYKDYSLDIKEANASAGKLISWDSQTELYVNALDGEESMYVLDDIDLDKLISMDAESNPDAQNFGEPPKEKKRSKEYIALFQKYSEIFSEELKVFESSEQLIQAISDNRNTDEIFDILESAIAASEESKETLNNYFTEFDSNRQEMPYGTRIMTLLSHAQSAITQYNIALYHLNDFLLSSNQDDLSDFQKYTEKAKQSLNDYNAILNEELVKIS